MMQPRPLGTRKTVQLLVILTILAWATQTLLHQWGFGDTTTALAPSSFATLELREQGKSSASAIKLRDVARWSQADCAPLDSLADLTITPTDSSADFAQVSVDDIKSTLHDAGISLATINFTGAKSCTVITNDATQEQAELSRWLAQAARITSSSAAPVPTNPVSPALSSASATTQPAAAPHQYADVPIPTAPPSFLVTRGQFLTVSLGPSGHRIQTVARAMDEGAYGSVIQARNEATGDVYSVTLTGAAEGTGAISVASIDLSR